MKVFSKSWVHPHDIQSIGGVEEGGGLGMAEVILRRWLLGTALNMTGHEGNHVVERIYFHSCGYTVAGITIVIIYHKMWLEVLGLQG